MSPEQEDNETAQEHVRKKTTVSVRDVFSFASEPKTKIMLCVGLFFSMLNGCMFPTLAYLTSRMFSSFSADEDDMMEEVEKLALGFVAVGCLSFIFGFGQNCLMEIVSTHMTQNFMTAWFSALLRQDMAYFDAELLISGAASSISSMGSTYKRGVGRKFSEGIQYTVTLVGGFCFAFYSSWKVTLVLIGVFPITGLSAFCLQRLNVEQSKDASKSFGEAGSVIYSTIVNIRTILSLNLVEHMISEFYSGTDKAYDRAAYRVGWVGFFNGLLFASIIFTYVVLTLFGSYLLYDDVRESGCDPGGASGIDCENAGQDIFGALVGIVFGGLGASQIGMALEAFGQARNVCYHAKRAIHRQKGSVYIVEKKNDNNDEEQNYSLPKYEIDPSSKEGLSYTIQQGAISLNDVSFCYPTRPKETIMNHLSIDIKPNSTIAFVGKSGSGKSSIINLIIRFYDPITGQITIDEKNLKELNVKSLRSQIGFVSQEPSLFNTTIKENIAFGKQNATQSEIEEAAKVANAHEFIESFPDKYETNAGERGGQLSGGQKQRIAIARAILKNPKILLLDEATSALDSESEKIVQAALDNILHTTATASSSSQRTRTTHVIVAHRLSTIQNADVIAVIVNGQIVEMDTHDNLMLLDNGHYKQLVQTQSGTTDKNVVQANEQYLAQDQTETENKLSILSANTTVSVTEKVQMSPMLSFNCVTFAYPTRPEKKILSKFSLSVRKNETLALVGPSGCGKSSVIALIERFYDPLSGTVELDGTNLRSFNVNELRMKMGFVQQEPVLFGGTIEENIAFGMKNATQSQIEQAAKHANAHEFIMSFPNGYKTLIGGGDASLISGGQKQRIAIARAILRKPQILLLDEATSALDSESEKIVQSTLDSLMKNSQQTIIVIAHRLSTIRNADRIAVISKEGNVCELGNHDELMTIENGIYRRLVQVQDAGEAIQKQNEESSQQLSTSFSSFSNISTTTTTTTTTKKEHEELFNMADLQQLTKLDRPFYVLGAIGAMLAGAVFPLWGIMFGEMIDLLYTSVQCNEESNSESNCESYYDSKADDIEEDSYRVASFWSMILVMSIVGYTLMYTGFGRATERLNKRMRDKTFTSLIRQEVGFFDTLNAATLTEQVQNDVSKLQAFGGQPIRTFVMNLCSVVFGVLISFVYMWQVALMAFLVIPLLALSAVARMKMLVGEDAKDETNTGESGAVIVEALVNIRTVASLTLEEHFMKKFTNALKLENSSYIKTAFILGVVAGYANGLQFMCMGFLFWWGGYIVDTYDKDVNDFYIAVFALNFGLQGVAIALQDVSDRAEAFAAAGRLFSIINRRSKIDPLADLGNEEMSIDDDDDDDDDVNPLEVPLLA